MTAIKQNDLGLFKYVLVEIILASLNDAKSVKSWSYLGYFWFFHLLDNSVTFLCLKLNLHTKTSLFGFHFKCLILS